MASDQKNVVEEWVAGTQRTFTRWINKHLVAHQFPAINDFLADWETGICLGNLVHSLYGVPLPRFNKAAKSLPQRLDNIAQAFKMVEDAHIKTNFLKPEHLIEHNQKMLLGMAWSFILDYAIKGISVDEMTAKEGLLLWCRKKTAGYKHIDPPGINNFSSHWKNGMAFCALIHRHRPDLIKYEDLDPANAEQNLELAFSVAEKELGIARLLEASDLTQTPKPDERSVMTYVSEFFHKFANQDMKEQAARRVNKFFQFMKDMEAAEHDYEDRASALSSWAEQKIKEFQEEKFGDTLDDAKHAFDTFKQFLVEIKPPKAAEKLDLEAKYAEIQTELKVNNRTAYAVPPNLSPDALEATWTRLFEAEQARGHAVRDNRFRFITKVESKIPEEKVKEFEESFAHFDLNGDGHLDRVEFKAACVVMSIPFKDDDSLTKVYQELCNGDADGITKEGFLKYMTTLAEDRDSPEQVIASFLMLSDQGDHINPAQLNLQPLTAADVEFIVSRMPKDDTGALDFKDFIRKSFS